MTACCSVEQVYRRNLKGGKSKKKTENRDDNEVKKYPFDKNIISNIQDAVEFKFKLNTEASKLVEQSIRTTLQTKLSQLNNHFQYLIDKSKPKCSIPDYDTIGFENYLIYKNNVLLFKSLDAKLDGNDENLDGKDENLDGKDENLDGKDENFDGNSCDNLDN